MDALFRIFSEELRETETVVVEGVAQLAHRLNALIQFGLKLAQPLGREVVVFESIVNGIGGHFSHFKRQQHTRRIDRIEKTVRVADQNEAVARTPFRSVRVIEDRIDLIHARALGDAAAARFALLYFLFEDLCQVLAAVF